MPGEKISFEKKYMEGKPHKKKNKQKQKQTKKNKTKEKRKIQKKMLF